ncbi:hypothetical protein RRG08_043493 [Elysia crispata]|uniref:Uncharacterized protein n=1 Tax=Elysia crispata TaxID=231223 RepID=A0AAE1CXV3_9GAST|nr:hypothetical protein RRG08_043493 [Elysia crispata]
MDVTLILQRLESVHFTLLGHSNGGQDKRPESTSATSLRPSAAYGPETLSFQTVPSCKTKDEDEKKISSLVQKQVETFSGLTLLHDSTLCLCNIVRLKWAIIWPVVAALCQEASRHSHSSFPGNLVTSCAGTTTLSSSGSGLIGLQESLVSPSREKTQPIEKSMDHFSGKQTGTVMEREQLKLSFVYRALAAAHTCQKLDHSGSIIRAICLAWRRI